MEERDDEMIERIAGVLRDEPMRRPGPSFDARVMASIRWSEEPQGASAALGWLVRPRRISLSPLAGLAFAASIAFAAYFGARGAVGQLAESRDVLEAATIAAADTFAARVVQFVLVAPDAESVSLAGDFNDWDAAATPLRSVSGNMWTVDVPLGPGRYNYVFVVNGSTLVADPAAARAPADEFGQRNSVITVGGSS